MTHRLPLFGKRIVVTRASGKSDDLAARLAAHGAEPIELPVSQIVSPEDGYAALDAAIARLADYDWLLFSSANGVEHFWQRLSAAGKSAASLRHLRVAAVGSATAGALAVRGLPADLIPPEFIAESLLAALANEDNGGIAGKRFLFPCAAAARPTLPEGLTVAGGQVSAPHAYRSVAAALPAPVLAALAQGVDVVTFLSGSAVQHFVEQLGPPRALVAVIGPTTAQAAQAAGLTVAIEAATHSVPGLVDAIIRYYLEH